MKAQICALGEPMDVVKFARDAAKAARKCDECRGSGVVAWNRDGCSGHKTCAVCKGSGRQPSPMDRLMRGG